MHFMAASKQTPFKSRDDDWMPSLDRAGIAFLGRGVVGDLWRRFATRAPVGSWSLSPADAIPSVPGSSPLAVVLIDT